MQSSRLLQWLGMKNSRHKDRPHWARVLYWTSIGVGVLLGVGSVPGAPPSTPPARFVHAKTIFQTNTHYDPRIAFAVDGMIVHRHGAPKADLKRVIDSWKNQGYRAGRMFFADSDATGDYWQGRWDGQKHEDEVERDPLGRVVKCAGVRPYMLPTEGWIRYLQEMTDLSIELHADAIFPEEPLAHLHTGYESAFRRLWQQRYGQPWKAESSSAEARYLTGQLKNELYLKLERQLASRVAQRAQQLDRPIDFILPIHSLYSNMASHLVAPLGTSLEIDSVDGYIGQIWTGPVNWARREYDKDRATFFASAFALYDYFVELVSGRDQKLWLLIDPVEDDPNHMWNDYELWYRHCVVAAMMMEEVDSYEVMPWPERIFLPGNTTGGGTPAPESYRLSILSVMQALQEVKRGGEWQHDPSDHSSTDQRPSVIGVAVADTLLWEKEKHPLLKPIYGLLMPLIQEGVRARACLLERMHEPAYRQKFDVILLSYEAFKPAQSRIHESIAQWVNEGGNLIVLGADDDLEGAKLWWKDKGYSSPLAHLQALLNVKADSTFNSIGKGSYRRSTTSPGEFVSSELAERELWPTLNAALGNPKDHPLSRPGYFHLERDPYVLAHAFSKPVSIEGTFVDVFDPDLRVVQNVSLSPDTTMLLKRLPDHVSIPQVWHATHRLMTVVQQDDVMTIEMRGPTETPAVVRLHGAGNRLVQFSARQALGDAVTLDVKEEGSTWRIRFPNHPDGVTLKLTWNGK